jgi:peptidoglycan hydrolase CwlO-like protein
MDKLKELLEVIALIGVPALTFFAGRATRKLNNAQARATETDSLTKLSDQILKLQNQIDELRKDQETIKTEREKFEDKNRVLWQYVYALIEQIKNKKIKPIDPPVELQSDPVLMKLFKTKKTK